MYKKIIEKTVRKVGKILLKEYNNFDRAKVNVKSKHEIVTKADLLSEEILIKEIKNNFPAHGILSEEKGEVKSSSDYLWIIDPIDGTTNFTMHNPLWSISIGLAHEGRIIFGVVYIPVTDELFVAEKGEGATLNNKKIKVSNIKGEMMLNTFCHGSTQKDLKKAMKYYQKQKLDGFDCRQIGSAAIELSYVACGRVESIAIPGAHSWDVAAGSLIVEEAGGLVTDLSGNDWSIESDGIVASNGLVHREILGALK